MMSDIIYFSTKRLSCFSIKDEIPFEENYDFAYQSVSATENCDEDYIGEYARAIKTSCFLSFISFSLTCC